MKLAKAFSEIACISSVFWVSVHVLIYFSLPAARVLSGDVNRVTKILALRKSLKSSFDFCQPADIVVFFLQRAMTKYPFLDSACDEILVCLFLTSFTVQIFEQYCNFCSSPHTWVAVREHLSCRKRLLMHWKNDDFWIRNILGSNWTACFG